MGMERFGNIAAFSIVYCLMLVLTRKRCSCRRDLFHAPAQRALLWQRSVEIRFCGRTVALYVDCDERCARYSPAKSFGLRSDCGPGTIAAGRRALEAGQPQQAEELLKKSSRHRR